MVSLYIARVRHGIFGGLIFGPGIFWGFAGGPRDFFGSWLFAPFDHPRHLKSRVPGRPVVNGYSPTGLNENRGRLTWKIGSKRRATWTQRPKSFSCHKRRRGYKNGGKLESCNFDSYQRMINQLFFLAILGARRCNYVRKKPDLPLEAI